MPSLTLLSRKLLLLLVLASLAGFAGCEKKKTAAEIQAGKVAAFRKHQKIEAIKAYTELVNKFPDSEHVAEARERLKALGPMPATPIPAKKQ
jgi:hypothetical protein